MTLITQRYSNVKTEQIKCTYVMSAYYYTIYITYIMYLRIRYEYKLGLKMGTI